MSSKKRRIYIIFLTLSRGAKMNKRQMGKVKIAESRLFDSKPFFENVFIVRCEMLYAEDCFQYHCYSELFRIKGLGEMIPEYECIIHEKSDDPTVSFVEFKELK
jgi:hypothetical protein